MSVLTLPIVFVGPTTGLTGQPVVGSGASIPPGIEAVLEYRGSYFNIRGWEDTYLIFEMDGLSDADIRDNREANPGTHGETAFEAFYGGRTITLTGRIRAHRLDKLRDMQQGLRQVFSDVNVEYPLVFTAGDPANDVMIYCKKSQPIAMREVQSNFGLTRDFMLTLRASNPRILSRFTSFGQWSGGTLEGFGTNATVTYTNDLVNPKAAINTTGWGAETSGNAAEQLNRTTSPETGSPATTAFEGWFAGNTRFNINAGMPVVPGDRVRFSGWMHLKDDIDTANLRITITDSAFGAPTAEGKPLLADVRAGWVYVECEVVADATETMKAYVHGAGNSYIQYIDGLSAPVHSFSLEEASGTTATNRRNAGNNGTYINTPTLGAASLIASESQWRAVTFTAAQSERVEAPNALAATDNFAIECLFKLPDLTNQNAMFVTNGQNDNQGFAVGIGDAAAGAGLRILGLFPGQGFMGSNYTVADTNLHHVIFTRNNGVNAIYVDGVKRTITTGSTTTGPLAAATGRLTIAAQHQTGTTFFRHFNGTLDEVSVYNIGFDDARAANHARAALAVARGVVQFTHMQLTKNASFDHGPETYVDGDLSSGEGYRWVGAPNNSASEGFTSSGLEDNWTADLRPLGASVRSGQLLVSSAQEVRHYRNMPNRPVDGRVTMKIVTPATIPTGPEIGAVFRGKADTSELLADLHVNPTATFRLFTRRDSTAYVGPVTPTTTTGGPITLTGNTSYWARYTYSGNTITCELFAADPFNASPAALMTYSYTLSGANATDFGSGIGGRVGYRFSSMTDDFRVDDFRIETLATGPSGETIYEAVNNGNFPAQPQLQISGPITNPAITFVKEEDQEVIGTIKFATGTVIPADNTWYIDVAKRTLVDQNGVNKFTALHIDSEWPELVPGKTILNLSGTSFDSRTSATVMWRHTWI